MRNRPDPPTDASRDEALEHLLEPIFDKLRPVKWIPSLVVAIVTGAFVTGGGWAAVNLAIHDLQISKEKQDAGLSDLTKAINGLNVTLSGMTARQNDDHQQLMEIRARLGK